MSRTPHQTTLLSLSTTLQWHQSHDSGPAALHATIFRNLLRIAIACALAFISLCLAPGAASAQNAYPSRSIHLIVPFAPGGSTDALARILASGLSEKLGQQVVVENRPGAGGNIAMGHVARAAPDGYHLLLASSSLVMNPSLYKALPYDPVASFAPVSYLAAAPSLLIAHAEEPYQTVDDLAAAMRKTPESFNFASPGAGTAQHLAGELFVQAINAPGVIHVPFNGAGPSVMAVMSHTVPIGFASLPAALPQVESGLLKALAITSSQRSPSAPSIPTFEEQGYKGVESDHLQGLLAPAGTPDKVVQLLAKASQEVLQEPHTLSRLSDLGFIVVASTPDYFAKEIREQVKKWDEVIRNAGLQLD